jgi:hypothetical protein
MGKLKNVIIVRKAESARSGGQVSIRLRALPPEERKAYGFPIAAPFSSCGYASHNPGRALDIKVESDRKGRAFPQIRRHSREVHACFG